MTPISDQEFHENLLCVILTEAIRVARRLDNPGELVTQLNDLRNTLIAVSPPLPPDSNKPVKG